MNEISLTANATLASQQGRQPRIKALAYGGGLMSPPGFGPCVIDLAGLEIEASVPLLADHNSTLNSVVGSGEPRIKENRLYVDGTLSKATDAGRKILELHGDGVAFQASVGVVPLDVVFVRPGQSVEVNGQKITATGAGFKLVRRGKLREVSVVALGADPSTSVSIAARAAQKGRSVEENEQGGGVVTLDPVVEEQKRIDGITAVCGNDGLLRAKAIDNDWTVEQARDVMVARTRGSAPDLRATHSFPRDTRGITAAVMSTGAIMAAFCRGEGMGSQTDATFDERTLEAADKIGGQRGIGIRQAIELLIKAEGRDVPSDVDSMIRAAQSMYSLPAFLSESIERIVLPFYREAPKTWQAVAKIVSAKDFRPSKALRANWNLALEQVGKNGQLPHGTVTEEGVEFQLLTFGKMFGVNRQDLINDDKGLISSLAPAMARSAARFISDRFWGKVLGAGTFFSAANGNLGEAGSALSVDTFSAGLLAMRTQKDENGASLDLMPKSLVVPPELETTGKAILNSLELNRTGDNSPTGNPHRDSVTLVVEPRLSNTVAFPETASASAWYLFATPADTPAVAVFRDGIQNPTVQTEPAPFNTLGQQWRCFIDFEAAMVDHRAAYKATGAAS